MPTQREPRCAGCGLPASMTPLFSPDGLAGKPYCWPCTRARRNVPAKPRTSKSDGFLEERACS